MLGYYPIPTMVERAQWLLDYLKGTTITSPVSAKRVGAFVTSKDCHAEQYSWQLALEEPGRILPHYEKFSIPTGTHSKPADIAEAHLADGQQGSNEGVYGAWKAQFEAWLDYVAQYWMTDEDIFLFSDREAKEMVVQQYDLADPPITVDDDRLQAIVEFLINIDPGTSPWQLSLQEWDVQGVGVTRPPDYIKITINEEDEYYSLSEAYFHMLSALNDIANGEQAIDYKELEPVIGPCEPSNCPMTTIDGIEEDDSVYRVFIWWQHDMAIMPNFSYETILAQMPALYQASFTGLVGPTFPDTSRQKRLRKIQALWHLTDDLGNNVKLNASEILYLMAKTLAYYYDSEHQPETFQHLPSHVLPAGYYRFLRYGRFKLLFGEENQLNWLDLGQRWTLKPAVLNESYR